MTKMTGLAFNRKFEKSSEYLGSAMRREEPVKAFQKKMGICPICVKPVFASQGQLLKSYKGVYFHKACRKSMPKQRK